MTICAIDPGDKVSAFVVYDGSTILDKGMLPNDELILCDWCVDLIAIEMIASYGMAVGANVFETCVWVGRFMQAFQRFAPIVRVKRGDVKMHLCQSMRAKDANVRQALIDRFGAPGTKKAPGITYGVSKDVWAALAVAVTVFERDVAA